MHCTLCTAGAYCMSGVAGKLMFLLSLRQSTQRLSPARISTQSHSCPVYKRHQAGDRAWRREGSLVSAWPELAKRSKPLMILQEVTQAAATKQNRYSKIASSC